MDDDGGGGSDKDPLLVEDVVVTNILCRERLEGGFMILSTVDGGIGGTFIFVDEATVVESTAAERLAPTIVRVLRVDDNNVEVMLVPSTVPVVEKGTTRDVAS